MHTARLVVLCFWWGIAGCCGQTILRPHGTRTTKQPRFTLSHYTPQFLLVMHTRTSKAVIVLPRGSEWVGWLCLLWARLCRTCNTRPGVPCMHCTCLHALHSACLVVLWFQWVRRGAAWRDDQAQKAPAPLSSPGFTLSHCTLRSLLVKRIRTPRQLSCRWLYGWWALCPHSLRHMARVYCTCICIHALRHCTPG